LCPEPDLYMAFKPTTLTTKFVTRMFAVAYAQNPSETLAMETYGFDLCNKSESNVLPGQCRHIVASPLLTPWPLVRERTIPTE
jgi:hypothetical protein